MTDGAELLLIKRVTQDSKQDTEDIVVKELPLTIILNGRELVTLLCSPTDLKFLSVGYLFSERIINSKDEIKRITIDERRGVARIETIADKAFASEAVFKRLITSGCGKGISFQSASDAQALEKVQSKAEISALEVINLMKDFQHHSQVFRDTGGVHSAALCDNSNILLFSEDIGRHNAIDKIFGQCLLEGISTENRIIITSGRVSSEIILKIARRNIPILVSKSAPTDAGVRLAANLGITLVGFARGTRMNVYANDWRINIDGK